MPEFKKLFNIEILHDYYTDGICRDFEVFPLALTNQLMQNNRLMFKNDNKGFRVLYRSEPGSEVPFIAFSDFDLKFGLKLKSRGSFENITNLNDTVDGKEYDAGNILFFKNTTQDAVPLDYDILDALQPSSFTYRFIQTASPGDNGVITISNEAGADVTPTYPDPSAVKADADGNLFYPIDFSKMPAGQYKFTTTVDSVVETQEFYIDNSLTTKNVFGIIKIHVEDYVDFAEDRRYTADFVKRETIWRYKMVLKSSNAVIGDELTIVDGASTYVFTRGTDESTNGIPTAVFDSDAEIPYSELPRKQFDFYKDPSGTPLLIAKNLSNPPAGLISAIPPNGIDPADFGTSVIYITV